MNRRDALSSLLGGSLWLGSGSLMANTSLRIPSNAKLDAALQAIVSAPGFELSSLSVLAMRAGKVTYHKQFGSRWIDPSNSAASKPADAATMYRIASISKTITALGAMKLVEQGKLKLDDDIGTYLGYPFRNPHFPDTAITLRQLLNHTSSIRDDAGYYWDAQSNTHLRDVFTPGGKHFGKGAMWSKRARPGAYFQYANLPWGVIGSVMEAVTRERFDRLMRRLILDPMKLIGGFHPAELSSRDLANVATLYRKRSVVNGKEVWNNKGPWVAQVDDYSKTPPQPRALADYVPGTNGTLMGPQGNCRLSAQSLGRVMLMLMDEGVIDGKPILKVDTVREMMRTQWQHNGLRGAGNSARQSSGASGVVDSNGDPNGESGFGGQTRLFNAWGLGMQHFLDVSQPNGGDRLVAEGGYRATGHLGNAWGLTSAMVFNPWARDGMVFLIGGSAFDPETHQGAHSGMYRHEEQILDALYTGAVNPR
jgi:CubicO group peptidase (beta-lactamase class C family)